MIAAVGTDPNGLKIDEVVRIINDIASRLQVIGLTITEHMPRVHREQERAGKAAVAERLAAAATLMWPLTTAPAANQKSRKASARILGTPLLKSFPLFDLAYYSSCDMGGLDPPLSRVFH